MSQAESSVQRGDAQVMTTGNDNSNRLNSFKNEMIEALYEMEDTREKNSVKNRLINGDENRTCAKRRGARCR